MASDTLSYGARGKQGRRGSETREERAGEEKIGKERRREGGKGREKVSEQQWSQREEEKG